MALNILHLEDNELDAELVAAELEHAGLDCRIRRAGGKAEFTSALGEGKFDLILADYSLPGFDGISALRMVRADGSEVPFLFVTGALGEELAIETLRSGATDYILKDRLARLVPAVRRALREAEDTAERKRHERELQLRARQQAAVAALGQRALQGIDVWVLMDEAVRVVARILDVPFTQVWERTDDGRLLLRAGTGWRPELVGRTVEPAGGTAEASVLATGEPMVTEDIAGSTQVVLPLMRDHGATASMTVAVPGVGRPLGTLGVHTDRPRRFSENDIHFLSAVAHVLSAAIERKRHEMDDRRQDLARAEQMSAVAQVATGVAHELRNPLTAIKMLIQANLEDCRARGGPVEDLAIIEQEIRRMERFLQTFLDFARPPKPQRRRIDLAETVDRTVSLITGRARRQQVEVRFVKPAAPVELEADPEQIHQLLVNLGLNALDAMPKGGRLTFAILGPRDGFVELRVSDTGTGIPASVLPKMFHRFITTKETGLGFGLAICRRIAEDHGGFLTGSNPSDGGAMFALRLPA